MGFYSVQFQIRFRTDFFMLFVDFLHAYIIGSRPSDHYFVVSVCLSVCLCRVVLSRLRSDLDQTRTRYMSGSSCVP